MKHDHELNLPWRVVRNWHGKIAIVDSRNNDKTTTSGRVCNIPQGANGRGLWVAQRICAIMNESAWKRFDAGSK
jgi:hypothetical protein